MKDCLSVKINFSGFFILLADFFKSVFDEIYSCEGGRN